MSERHVVASRTEFSTRDFAHAVLRAWRLLCGVFPSRATVGLLWSQYALETGRGKACWNHNIGNVKHVVGDGYDFIMLPNTWEVIGDKRVVFQPPHPATWFRAYPSLDSAMTDHIEMMRAKRYAIVWPTVEAGDPVAFARELKRRGYYTAPEADYARGLSGLHREFMSATAYDEALADILRAQAADTERELPTSDELPVTEEDGGASRREATTDAIVDAVRDLVTKRNA